MAAPDYFEESCSPRIPCQMRANKEDTVCACRDQTTGGSKTMRRLFEEWLEKSITTTTTTTTTTVPPDTTTATDATTVRPTVAPVTPAPRRTRSLVYILSGAGCTLVAAAAAAAAVLWNARRRLRSRGVVRLLDRIDDTL